MDVGERNILLLAVGQDAPRCLRGQPQQRFDSSRSLRASLEFEHLPQKRERDNHRSSLEVDADAAILDEGCRKPLRYQGSEHTVEIGSCRSQTNQGPHVGATVTNGVDAAGKEYPAAP